MPMFNRRAGQRGGLALGGGAARGLAHLGVLQVLEREKIPIDLIAGTSMGGLVGALYCAQPWIDRLIKKATAFYSGEDFKQSRLHRLKRGEEEELGFFGAVGQKLRQGRLLSSQVTRLSFLDKEDLYNLLRPFVDDRDIRSLQIPLSIITCDLKTGREIVINKGSVIDAVAASSAVPGAFPPIPLNGVECIDGGTVNMVPIRVAREMGADLVIAVNVSHEMPKPAELKRALEIFFRTHEITKRTLIDLQLPEADVGFTPQGGQYHWADFSQADQIIDMGRQAAETALPEIRRVRRRRKSLFHFRRAAPAGISTTGKL